MLYVELLSDLKICFLLSSVWTELIIMQISEFNYQLPDELIAQNPLEKREISRMLVVDRQKQSLDDVQFLNLSHYLKENDLIVLNNTKVFPARLFGKSETGAKVELFLIEEMEDKIWQTLARPGEAFKGWQKN